MYNTLMYYFKINFKSSGVGLDKELTFFSKIDYMSIKIEIFGAEYLHLFLQITSLKKAHRRVYLFFFKTSFLIKVRDDYRHCRMFYVQ